MGRASIFSGLGGGGPCVAKDARYVAGFAVGCHGKSIFECTVVILPEVADLCSDVPSRSKRGLWEGDADAAGASASGHIPTLHGNRSGVEDDDSGLLDRRPDDSRRRGRVMRP